MRTKIISETIVTERDDAICRQEITYANHGELPLRFAGISETLFHSNCSEFRFDPSSGPIVPRELATELLPYHVKFMYELSGELQPGHSSTIAITYKWSHFRTQVGFERIATTFDSLTTYNLKIVVNDDSFTNHLISIRDGDDSLVLNHDYFITHDGSLSLSRHHLSPNSRLDLRITANIRNISLPVVDDVATVYGKVFDGISIILVIHLLRDSLPFINAILEMGINKPDLFIIGIPYSSKDEVYEYLINSQFNVLRVSREAYYSDFHYEVRSTLTSVCAHCASKGKKLLIVEDGGYIVPLLHREFQDCLPLCLGAVEQTANGIWADREIAEEGQLAFPVLNVAESRIKRDRESPLVGKAIVQNINRLLEGYGTSLRSQNVGQIGFGTIGRSLAEQLRNDAESLIVFDKDLDRLKLAQEAGFDTVEKLTDLFPKKTLIIGCTGEEIVGLTELRSADRSIFFINGTSKLRELKYAEFLRITSQPKILRRVGREYRLRGGKQITIRLLADGFPVNFFESSESIPDREIQFIPALLLAAAAYLIKKSITEKAIIPIPAELEKQLEESMALNAEID